MTNLVGQVAIVAAIDLVCAQTVAATLALPVRAAYPIFVALLAAHAALNVISVRLVAWLNDFSATLHVVGVVAIVVILLAFGRAQPPAFLAQTGFTTRGDGVYALGFANALVLGAWTFTGFDASAHVSEETHDPARRAPWGIVSAVAVSAVAGFALVAAITLAVDDVSTAAKEKETALSVLRHALGERAGRASMGLVVVAMAFAGLSSVTSASRMLFAFARDGGVPFASALRRVSPRFKTPHIATIAVVAAPLALVAATAPFSETVFLAAATLATTALYVSYALPIALGALARARGRWRHRGPWHLRARASTVVAWVAVTWTACVLAVCALANVLGALILAAILGALALLWFAWVRPRFTGPKVELSTFERDA
jgi:amino acid transporter